jgi:hypothetical protein
MPMSTMDLVEDLAAEIGDRVYIDVAKWHLYLRDAKLHTELAQKLYTLMENGAVKEADVTALLQGMMIKLGGGKKELPLSDLVPMSCQVSLMDVVEEFQRKM